MSYSVFGGTLNIAQSILQYSTAGTLRYAVTFTFEPLTLNMCSVSTVTWANSVPHFRQETHQEMR